MSILATPGPDYRPWRHEHRLGSQTSLKPGGSWRTSRHRAGSHGRTLRGLFVSLDFVYLPSRDAAADVIHFELLGGKVIFAIEAFSTRVAMVDLTGSPPALLLAEHLEGTEAVLVFRVRSLEQALSELHDRGGEVAARFEIPHGPGAELVLPGPQRLAAYELTRPEAPARLSGRRDF